ncbi:protein-glutamine gamma-glutamyltransferase 2 [Polymixia lowei]
MDLRFKKIDQHCETNNSAHHTSDISTDQLIVRRGQSFLMTLEVTRPYNPTSDHILISAVTDVNGSQERGTKSVFGIPEGIVKPSPAAKAVWKAELHSSSFLWKGSVTLEVTPPADAPVGQYRLTADTQRASLGTLVVLFNPWCSDDWVYLPDEEERQEYVMNEQGIIYTGSGRYISPTVWDYGQFEQDMVAICLKILDVNPKHMRDPADDFSARCNPIYVGRVVSAMINSVGDYGVLEGRWHDNYSGGVPPTRWDGSVEILQQWFRTSCRSVKYGQCWVFAGVMCTVMRCLGIPCRVVTNFKSAHDTNKNLSIDVFHVDSGVQPKQSNDSVWNFHVWVEAWMTRPDLQQDGRYDGWQVLDPTPQERSKGVYCCGPAPVAAIKNGETHLKYDIPFVFAEVNADCIDWFIKADGSKIKMYCDSRKVGQNVSTKSVNSNRRRNITKTYKHKEGTKKERSVYRHAITRDYSRGEWTEEEEEEEEIEEEEEEGETPNGETPNGETPQVVSSPQKVSMRIEQVSAPINGQDISLKLILHSKDAEPRPLSISICSQAMRYTGVPGVNLNMELKEETLQPGRDLSIPIVIPFSVYGKHMLYYDSLKVSAVARDEQDQEDRNRIYHVYLAQTDIVLRHPPMSMTVVGQPQVDRDMKAVVEFPNPINEVLRDCTLTFTGSGLLQERLVVKLADLPRGRMTRCSITFSPYKSGLKTLVADFDCSSFRDIKTNLTINVKPCYLY